ncbi:MAG: DUF3617 family protein [Anaeromyxobacter sp.]
MHPTRWFLAALAAFALPAAAQSEPGTLWEHTSQVQMKGMAVPPTTSTFCAPKDGLKEPPQPKDQKSDCRMENLKNDGKKMSWTMVCQGDHAMSGEGQITYGPKAFDGLMTMRSSEMGEMSVKISGKNLGQACDAGAMKRQVAGMQAQAAAAQQQQADSMKQLCAQGEKEMSVQLFSGPYALCKEPAMAQSFCARWQTREGFQVASKQGEQGLQQIGQLCKASAAQVQKKLCPDAARDAARPDGAALDFVGQSCPEEARTLAKAECAGRAFTGMQPPMSDFCVRYAREVLSAEELAPPKKGAAAEPAKGKPDAKDEAVNQGKKLLKGFFGR